MAAVEEPEPRDGIVFVVGHAEFVGNSQGNLCRRETPGLMSHRTLLVGNINTYSQFNKNYLDIEANIKKQYKRALTLTDEKIAEIAFLDKLDIQPYIKLNHVTNKEVRKRAEQYFKVPVLFSTDPGIFCERTWYFSDQDTDKPVREGTILLLHKVGSKTVFTPLYSKQLNTGKFKLTKSELFEHIRTMYELDNILLVDSGCTVCRDVSAISVRELSQGKFGGTKKKMKRKRPRQTRRVARRLARRTV
jgi:hypothetical protein